MAGQARRNQPKGIYILIGILCVIVVVLSVIVASLPGDESGEAPFEGSETEASTNTSTIVSPTPGNTEDVPQAPTSAPATQTPSKDYNMVVYKGNIEHVFTHSLIAFPELAYQSITKENFMQNTYFIDCITVKEFKAILQALYQDGYMLINLNDFYEAVLVNGSTQYQVKKNFLFPEGKKPLVFSFDDTNYYSDKLGRGMVDKLILNEEGRVVTYTKMKDGREVISDDNEFIPVLDQFVATHPDFSYNGAKGMICLTGYDGILGYRTQRIAASGLTESQRQDEIQKVKPIVQALKDTGWYFASHSYKHGRMAGQSASWMEDDAAKFKNEVTPLIGETKIYVYPYGSWQQGTGGSIPASQKVLNNYGFNYFCGVGVGWFSRTANSDSAYWKEKMNFEGVIFQDRANLDGSSFIKNQALFATVNGKSDGTPRFPSLDFSKIYDDARGLTYTEAMQAYQQKLG